MTSSRYYYNYNVGGPLPPDSESYVVRQADDELLDGLRQSEFCYILTSRQMGKSSLMARTVRRLATEFKDEHWSIAVLDVTSLGQSSVSPQQWYNGLLVLIGEQLRLDREISEFRRDYQGQISPLQLWEKALREVVLKHCPGPVAIFIDEIDAVRSLSFSTDEFFAAIRAIYNRRSLDKDLNRLTFCLIGMATPSELILDTHTTPFNIGRRIELTDFTQAEALPLAGGFRTNGHDRSYLLESVLYWTGGHPYLTQQFCQAVANDSSIVDASGVRHLCKRLFLSQEALDNEPHLQYIAKYLLQSRTEKREEKELASLLDLYNQVRINKYVPYDTRNPLKNVLHLSGIVQTEYGHLVQRNRIYAAAFNGTWVRENMPDAEKRRQGQAYRRGWVRSSAFFGMLTAIIVVLGLTAYEKQREVTLGIRKVIQAQQSTAKEHLEASARKAEAASVLLQYEHAKLEIASAKADTAKADTAKAKIAKEAAEHKVQVERHAAQVANAARKQALFAKQKAQQLAEAKTAALRQLDEVLGNYADNLVKLADTDTASAQYEAAVDELQKSYHIFEKLNIPVKQARCYKKIADIYQRRGLYDPALKAFLRAEEISETLDDQQEIAYCLTGMGIACENLKRPDEALNHYLHVLDIRKKLNNEPDTAASLYHVGHVYEQLDQNDKALNYYTQSLELREHPENFTPESMIESLEALGNVYEKLGKKDTAATFRDRANNFRKDSPLQSVPLSQPKQDKTDHSGWHPASGVRLAAYRQSTASSKDEPLLPLPSSEQQELIRLKDEGINAYYRGDYKAAEKAWRAGLEKAQAINDNSNMVKFLNNLGHMALHLHDLVAAEDYYKRTLEIQKKLVPESLAVADSLNNLGKVAYARGDYAVAESYLKRALEIQDKLAPESLDVANTLHNLGNVAAQHGDLTTDESYYKRALEIWEKLTPGSLAVADSLNNLGVVAFDRGDLVAAESYYKRALEIREKLAPESLDIAGSLDNLGSIAEQQGNLLRAKEYYMRALAIQEKRLPGSLDVATSLNHQGSIAEQRGDLTTAESYYKRALEIREKLAPGSLTVADSLNNLGVVAFDRGDLTTAESYYKRALEIREKLAPGSLTVADSLNNLGVVAFDRGDLTTAESYYKRALEIREKLAPGSLTVADSLNNLGKVAYARHDFVAADICFKRALEIREKLAPYSLAVARSYITMGMVREKLQHPEEALQNYFIAAAILEAQRGNIAGTQARKLLVEAHTDAFTALFGAYVTLHQDAHAFNTLERIRGRSLAENLFEHLHIDFNKDVLPALLAQQKALDNERSQALKERQKLDPNDPKDQPGYTKNTALLQEISVKQRQLEDEMRHAYPRYANLQYPKPLDLNAVQNTLDPGTLLLEYAIDEQKTYLFTVTKNSFHCYKIAIQRKDLLAKVQSVTDSVEKENAPRNSAVSIALYNLLLRPAQKEILAAKRLLFCPEKELWKIPFCALIDNNNASAPHYLIESKPIHCVVSMNVYAQLIKDRKQPRTATHSLLAFGDPAYRTNPQNKTASNVQDGASAAVTQTDAFAPNIPQPPATVSTQRLLLGGHYFEPRAITGDQVRAIAALFGKRAVVHLGKEATPSVVLKEAGSARVLHFACHGWMDGGDPLASFLALSPERPTDQYGMLAAYDVIQNLRLNADLVTLAASETGAGELSSTEGVIGLTRAFEYAGAHSVLVTLWEIDANSSSQMLSGTDPLVPGKTPSKSAVENSFYGALLAGKSKDEALRTAQIALIHGKSIEYRDPKHWAAFSLQGDWR